MNNWEPTENGLSSVSPKALAWLDELAERYCLEAVPFDTCTFTSDQRRLVSRGRYVDPFTGQAKPQARILAHGEATVLVRARADESGQFMVDLCAPGFPHNHHRNLWCWWWELELLLLLMVK